MKIIYTRHGETDWNLQYRVMGRTDIALNEKGKNQAEGLKEKLKDYNITKVYSSPLKRAFETAKTVADSKNLTVTADNRLIERNYGIFEGKSRGDKDFLHNLEFYFKRLEKGESYMDLAARVYPFLKEVIDNSDNDDVILIVAHGGISRVVNSYFKDMTNEEFNAFLIDNCEIAEYDVKK